MAISLRPTASADTAGATMPLARARGKFLYAGDEKLYVRGVTYGTFRPNGDGSSFPEPSVVRADFAMMAESAVNTIRTYEPPPRWLLDLAALHGLRVMVGLPWEQHVAFLDERERPKEIEARVRQAVRGCAGHPAVLCYAVGNEIPASVVRWLGRRRTERFIERLYRAAKAEDPQALVTYVSYPTTEYLRLPFLDLVCFNVYLEKAESLRHYLARLQNIAGDRPLIMTELGVDSRRHGLNEQALALDWQVRTAFASGCAGAFVFAWTDEWHRGGYDIEDWDFGLTDRLHRPKPALKAVTAAFREVPFSPDTHWPKVSVVVCSYNGERTLPDCLEGLRKLAYPDYEVIVVNDGSTDNTPAIASEHPLRLISTQNRGLSCARNTGMEAASGEIVAYTDDDARPDAHWLHYLAEAFMREDVVAVGGPNIAPPGDGWIADCVANSPGGPVHVLVSDTEAEHIPGCNMAFRKEALQAIGGFDVRYRAAGDDVDVCWRLQEQGGRIGFHAGAMVWHHRRNSLRAYWKQQQGYGKAEALLEAKWPEKYNPLGHLTWRGRLYGKGLTPPLPGGSARLYGGSGGRAPFQSIYEPSPGLLRSLPLMPEWVFLVLALTALSALGGLWRPLLLTLPFLGVAIALPVTQAVLAARRASFTSKPRNLRELVRLRSMTFLMHLMQPLARLRGRLRWGLTPWRARGPRSFTPPRPATLTVWSEDWRAQETRMEEHRQAMRDAELLVFAGGDFDRWDLEVRAGLLGRARTRLGIEEHGGGRQLVRCRVWPRFSVAAILLATGLAGLSAGAAADGAWAACAILAVLAAGLAGRVAWESGVAIASARQAFIQANRKSGK